MQNQSLDSHLYPTDIDVEPLSWGTRLKITIGVARGLSYLHSSNIIHRNLTTREILLDQDFNPKLAGFWLARFGPQIGETHVSTRVVGTIAYMDPLYALRGQLSEKSDVYSLGVVLLETLTGRKPTDMPDEQNYLLGWAIPMLAEKGELKKIIDPRIENNYPEEGVFEYAKLALRCLEIKPQDRPSSEEVLSTLEQIYVVTKEWKDDSRHNM